MTFAPPEKNAADMQVDPADVGRSRMDFSLATRRTLFGVETFKPRFLASKAKLGVRVFCIIKFIGDRHFRRHQDGSWTDKDEVAGTPLETRSALPVD